MSRGFLISFEGIDDSGKTTQLRQTESYLEHEGFDTYATREPGGTTYAEFLRILLKSDQGRSQRAEILTFEAARADIVEISIRPQIESGKIVLLDRFTDSTLAYQGYGGKISLEDVVWLNRFATGGLTPALTLLYDVKPKDSGFTDAAYFEQKGISFQETVRRGYLELAKQYPDRIKVVQRVPAETVEESIQQTFERGTKPLIDNLLKTH